MPLIIGSVCGQISPTRLKGAQVLAIFGYDLVMWRFPGLVRHLSKYRDDDTRMTLLDIGDAVAHGTWDMSPEFYEEGRSIEYPEYAAPTVDIGGWGGE